MAQRKKQKEPKLIQLAKCPTGIRGLDEITNGGLPQGRRAVLARKRQVAEAQVAALQAEIAGEEAELQALLALEQEKGKMVAREREELANLRKADASNPAKGA
jgi:hypothetical protein